MATTVLYSDLDSSFLEHPIKRELYQRTDEDAVKDSIRNLVSTKPYERPFNPQLGCMVYSQLFEPMTALTQSAIQDSIREVITNFEPRANLIEVDVTPDFDGMAWSITIVFSILNRNDAITLPILLKRVR